MRSMTMRGLILAASMLAGSAHASLELNTSLDCGQTLLLDQPASSTQRLSCAGDFTISGGSIVFDDTLVIYAGGNLTLSNLLVKGPALKIHSPAGNITIGSDVIFETTGTQPPDVDTVNVLQRPPFPLSFAESITLNADDRVLFNQPGASATITVMPEAGRELAPSAIGLDGNGHIYLTNPGRIQITVQGKLEVFNAGAGGTPPSFELQAGVVPEPGTWALMAAGLSTLLFARRRRG